MKIDNNPKIKTIVEDELIQFVEHIKKATDVAMDLHLLDHMIWIIEEHYKSPKPKKSNKNRIRRNFRSPS